MGYTVAAGLQVSTVVWPAERVPGDRAAGLGVDHDETAASALEDAGFVPCVSAPGTGPREVLKPIANREVAPVQEQSAAARVAHDECR